jgi:pyridoxal phosphate enzyme (YggS family)
MPIVTDTIAARLAEVRTRIARAADAAGRDPAEITLVAVSKTMPAEAIREAIGAGQTVFGENRVQEAKAKYPALREEFPDLELHLIGPLQSNKAREAVALFDVIQTVDRKKIAEVLAAEMLRAGKAPKLFVEVNTGEEPQKAGIPPLEVDAFVALCRDELRLAIEGLMCIPPADEPPAPHFALLEKIARRNGLSGVSMGMSADYETAIALGASHVRVGSAIFGARPPIGAG